MKIKLGEGIRQEKQFFFEKKNQKTLGLAQIRVK
jgi:hypothetical protein